MEKEKRVKLSREEIAKREIGVTEVSRLCSIVCSVVFLAFIASYTAIQLVSEASGRPWREMAVLSLPRRLAAAENHAYAGAIKQYETDLEDVSLLRKHLLAPAQRFLFNCLNTGNEKVVAGRDGYLFYTAGFDYLTHPGVLRPEQLKKRTQAGGAAADPVAAITDFDRQLKERGIKLVLLPMTVKPVLYGDKLVGGGIKLRQNPSYGEFLRKMRDAGVEVFDADKILLDWRLAGIEAFLKTDTHLTPEGVEAVAVCLAGRISGNAVRREFSGLEEKNCVAVENCGDIALMLKLAENDMAQFREKVRIMPHENAKSKESDVLLLGDSFTNIYSLGAMNWGEKSGLAERLSFHLGRSVDVIARNDSGAYATRELLAKELMRGNDRLKGKKFVIWEFAVRELALGDWKIIELPDVPETEKTSDKSSVPGASVLRSVKARVLAVSEAVRPHSVPYKDHVMALHLELLSAADDDGGELVYVLGMLNNVPQKGASLKAGDIIEIRLQDFAGVEDKYGAVNRSELDSEELLLKTPLWGEITGTVR